jgi:superfamily II DNA or RNA helicase
MFLMILKEPTKIYLPETTEEIKRFLTFTDRSVNYQIHKLKNNFRWASGDPEGHANRIKELKEQSVKTLIFDDENGKYTYSGLINDLKQRFNWDIVNHINYPEPNLLPWSKKPEFDLRPYQKEAVESLKKVKHGAVELPTGSGKSACIIQLIKDYGLKTIVMTPSRSITEQIYQELCLSFGKNKVGKFSGTKKEIKKLIIVATGQSLTRIDKESEDFKELIKTQIFIADESHSVPADTFEAVCMGVASKAPYRFFFSATQLRTDGSEMILKGITGPVVYRKTFKELVLEGFLSPPKFLIFKVNSEGAVNRQDVNQETRKQLFENTNVAKLAAQIADKSAQIAKRKTLILIDELVQYDIIKNYLMTKHEFISGSMPQKKRAEIIKDFNEGDLMLLVGTSAISTGVDLKPTASLVYLQGGTSEIQVKQAIGRGTRIFKNKKDLWVSDFLVLNSRHMERHLKSRIKIYETLGEVKMV